MAGRTILATYERADGTFGPIRVSAVSVTTWNPVATGTKTGYFVKARGSKKQYGVVARSVSLSRSIGGPDAYSSGTVNVKVPVFQESVWDGLVTGQVLAYGGLTDWKVSGTNAEESK